MDEIKDFFAEMQYDWKHHRREFVENALGAIVIFLVWYVFLIVGSAGGAK